MTWSHHCKGKKGKVAMTWRSTVEEEEEKEEVEDETGKPLNESQRLV